MRKNRKEQNNEKAGWLAPILAVLLFFVGVGIFAYPSVSNYIAEKYQATVIQEYEESLSNDDSAELEAEWEKAIEYNENLAGDPVHDPFVPGSGYALPDNYYDVLDVDGVMGYVEIPKISVRLPIYHGTTEEVLQKGVGHIEATALPIGGEYCHSVLTGHRGLPSAELFTRLDEMEIGDIFLIHVLGETLAYKVDQIKTVLPNELDDIRALEGMDLVTLLTCTPYGINTHRMLVRGQRTEYIPEEVEAQNASARILDSVWDNRMIYIGIGLGLALLLIAFVIYKIVSKKFKKEDSEAIQDKAIAARRSRRRRRRRGNRHGKKKG